KIEVEVMRDGKPLKVSAELREPPPDSQTARAIPQPGQPNPSNPLPQPNAPDTTPDQDESDANPFGSMRVSELTPDLAKRLDLPTGVHGVVVDAADFPELQRGDVIEEIDQQPVTSVNEFNKVVAGLDPDSTHVFSMCRHRVRSFIVVRPR
ncbi:MAG TPA: hypothetical protein VHQ95_24700, partial [Pyrinomonadaceae bacterium]|nr:hypothetical protein [Pyrinomonadaceae bacterium]